MCMDYIRPCRLGQGAGSREPGSVDSIAVIRGPQGTAGLLHPARSAPPSSTHVRDDRGQERAQSGSEAGLCLEGVDACDRHEQVSGMTPNESRIRSVVRRPPSIQTPSLYVAAATRQLHALVRQRGSR
jgi:hypothetical protein